MCTAASIVLKTFTITVGLSFTVVAAGAARGAGPVEAPPLAAAIAVDTQYGCAIKRGTGAVVCWGRSRREVSPMEHQLVVDSHPRVSRFGIMPALRQRFTFGLRLVDVASATGLSVGSLSEIERGLRVPPDDQRRRIREFYEGLTETRTIATVAAPSRGPVPSRTGRRDA